MSSAEDLKQAGRDVLHYHSRRVYVPKKVSKTDYGIFYGSMVVSWGGLLLSKVANIPGMILAFSFPVCNVVLLLRFLLSPDNTSRRQDAAGAVLRYDRAIHLLTHSTDAEAVAPLLDILGLPGMTGGVPHALGQLLPRLQQADAPLLNRKQRDTLMFILMRPDSVELQRAVVQAIATIGDGIALPVLDHLACGAWEAADSPELREDAITAVVALRKRLAADDADSHLLRASDVPVVPPDELLRSAIDSSETPPEELLRARKAP